MTPRISELDIDAPAQPLANAYDRLLGRSDAAVGAVTVRAGEVTRIWFTTEDVAASTTLLQRRGIATTAAAGGVVLDASPALGVRSPASVEHHAGDIVGLDHVVLLGHSLERIVTELAGGLDLNWRLTRELPGTGHQLFFRTATETVVEVIVADQPGNDQLTQDEPDPEAPTLAVWGLAWRSADIEATHARLTATGTELSEVRRGRKPGTRIFTVRDPDLGLPTVVIGD